MTQKNPTSDAEFLDLPYRESDVAGMRLAYRECGNGPVLVLLHGWPLHGETYAALAATLAPHYRCIVPDLPGAGQTRWSGQHDLSPAGQAQLLEQETRARKIAPCPLLTAL